MGGHNPLWRRTHRGVSSAQTAVRPISTNVAVFYSSKTDAADTSLSRRSMETLPSAYLPRRRHLCLQGRLPPLSLDFPPSPLALRTATNLGSFTGGAKQRLEDTHCPACPCGLMRSKLTRVWGCCALHSRSARCRLRLAQCDSVFEALPAFLELLSAAPSPQSPPQDISFAWGSSSSRRRTRSELQRQLMLYTATHASRQRMPRGSPQSAQLWPAATVRAD